MDIMIDFVNEDELQRVIAERPELLAPCLEADTPRGWLLVQRECHLRTGLAAASSKPVDHLFLDALGIPTFVEVKLQRDARTRREVVGQMMDYLSAAIDKDPAAKIEQSLHERCHRFGTSTNQAIVEAFAGRISPATLWSDLRAALAEQRFRVIFVVDRVPAELASSIHTLDRLMPTVTVQGLEVRKFQDGANFRYESELVTMERCLGRRFAPTVKARDRSQWTPLPVRERPATSVTLPESRTRLVPLPKGFCLEATVNYCRNSRHHVDPSRPESHIAVMPNLDLLARTGMPYPAEPDGTVQTDKRWLPWLEIARVAWERLSGDGEVQIPRDSEGFLAEAARRAPALTADPKFGQWGRRAVLDALRDLQLYGLCQAFQRGREWRFVFAT